MRTEAELLPGSPRSWICCLQREARLPRAARRSEWEEGGGRGSTRRLLIPGDGGCREEGLENSCRWEDWEKKNEEGLPWGLEGTPDPEVGSSDRQKTLFLERTHPVAQVKSPSSGLGLSGAPMWSLPCFSEHQFSHL